MPDFVKIPAPIGSPTSCPFCHTHADPRGFADRAIEIPHYGRLQVCAQCALDMARLFGAVDGEVYAAVVARVQELEAELELTRLELELEQQPEAKVVDLETALELAKVINLDEERKKRRPTTKAAS